jgi:hypothetical protein
VKPVLIRQHVDSAPVGLLGEWLEARGLAYEVQDTWVAPGVPDPADYAVVAALGAALTCTIPAWRPSASC